ncbi:hypothetical protein PUMCH_002192 [Australozyma saopauloensis]|uniref:mRNA cap guanine-N(7) methyltransferase n=1 Tax=Australozyma saopauloensis TaxID=291208 RepID=A0AAX4H8K3_9ASCO|nr:hypothetical protein PUMCH_002192 [[Candida] saopauloensis]
MAESKDDLVDSVYQSELNPGSETSKTGSPIQGNESTIASTDNDNSTKKRNISETYPNESSKTLSSDPHSALSRRGISHSTQHKKASVYTDTNQEVPAWMRSKLANDAAHKYDKYGGRRTVELTIARSEESKDPYAKYASPKEDEATQLQPEDPYAKYGARPRQQADSRVIRRDPEPERKRRHNRPEPVENVEEPIAEVAAYTSVPSLKGPGNKTDYKTFQSNISHKENKDINSIVRQHYNQRTHQSKLQGSRTRSPIYKMRNFNNAIKYILLGNWVKRRAPNAPLVFLDLCCGKGGDLNKCEFVNVDQYIGIDISDASVREAFSRYSQNKARFIPQNPQSKRSRDSRRYNFEACFATGDLFSYTIPEILEKNFSGIIDALFPVDAVSIQFSFHYAWETEDKVRTILTNVSRSLRPGGTFIGTIPSSDFIRSKILKKEFTEERTFGNDLYHVRFEQEPPEDGHFESPYGNRYDYFLKDAVDDVPEYVVPFETLRLLCEDYGLILKYKQNFPDIFNLEIPNYFSKLNKNLVDGMKRADGKYGVEGDEKEAVAFYIGFVFEKVGN